MRYLLILLLPALAAADLPDPEVPVMIEQLGDRGVRARAEARRTLLRADRAAIPALRAAERHPRRVVRHAVRDVLDALTVAGVPGLSRHRHGWRRMTDARLARWFPGYRWVVVEDARGVVAFAALTPDGRRIAVRPHSTGATAVLGAELATLDIRLPGKASATAFGRLCLELTRPLPDGGQFSNYSS